MEETKKLADEYAELATEKKRIDNRLKELEAHFAAVGTDALRNSKNKTVEYWGTQNARVTVSTTQAAKLHSIDKLTTVLGDSTDKYAKEVVKSSIDMTADCKRLLTQCLCGEYLPGNLDDTIRQITSDDKLQTVLHKKLKGKYDKDKFTLVTSCHISDQEASDTAYLISEIVNWGWICQHLRDAGWTGSPQQAIALLHDCATVEEGIRVQVAYEDTAKLTET